jgi:hypothetical protein
VSQRDQAPEGSSYTTRCSHSPSSRSLRLGRQATTSPAQSPWSRQLTMMRRPTRPAGSGPLISVVGPAFGEATGLASSSPPGSACRRPQERIRRVSRGLDPTRLVPQRRSWRRCREPTPGYCRGAECRAGHHSRRGCWMRSPRTPPPGDAPHTRKQSTTKAALSVMTSAFVSGIQTL